MLCSECGGVSKVCDTRYDGKENEVFRHHMCNDCLHEFFTIEFEIENNKKFANMWKKLTRGAGKSYGYRKNE